MRQPMNHPISELHKCCNDGHSTYFWCTTGAKVFSVDIDYKAVKIARKSIRQFKNGKVFWGDGLKFLKNSRGQSICFFGCLGCRSQHFLCRESSFGLFDGKDKLNDRNIIAVDDTDIGNGGKGRLLLPVLKADGYDILVSGRQTIALKNISS